MDALNLISTLSNMSLRKIIATIVFASVTLAAQSSKDFGAYKAKEIRNSDLWINGGPLNLKSLRGKVVVLDFWAFAANRASRRCPTSSNCTKSTRRTVSS